MKFLKTVLLFFTLSVFPFWGSAEVPFLGFIKSEESASQTQIQNLEIFENGVFLYQDFQKLIFEKNKTKFILLKDVQGEHYKAVYDSGILSLLLEQKQGENFLLFLYVLDTRVFSQPQIIQIAKSLEPFQFEMVSNKDIRGDSVFIFSYTQSSFEKNFFKELKLQALKVNEGIPTHIFLDRVAEGNIEYISLSQNALFWNAEEGKAEGVRFISFEIEEDLLLSRTVFLEGFQKIQELGKGFFLAENFFGEIKLLQFLEKRKPVLLKKFDFKFSSIVAKVFSYEDGFLLAFIEGDEQFDSLVTRLYYLSADDVLKEMSEVVHPLPSHLYLGKKISFLKNISQTGEIEILIASSVKEAERTMTYKLVQKFERY
ncbi:MAG: hypothetical protein HYW47_04670 [Deltaproteobacteria bacterium]|nr:hypothetical protein [Deltaproteobacteria bacterium]